MNEKVNEDPTEKNYLDELPALNIYNEKMIWFGGFIGGPLIAGYLIAENFKAFKQEEYTRKTYMITIIVSLIILSILIFLPDTIKIPNQLIPIIYMSFSYSMVKYFQDKSIKLHVQNGGAFYSWWRTIKIAILGLIISFGIIFSMALLKGFLF